MENDSCSAMDSKTSLPLSHSLLEFYRHKLKSLSLEVVNDIRMRMDSIHMDVQSAHVLQTHVANCESDLTTLTMENKELRKMIVQFLEENARLRLDRGLKSPDQELYESLLQRLTQRPHIHQDNSAILTSLIKRCQDLESLAYKKYSLISF